MSLQSFTSRIIKKTEEFVIIETMEVRDEFPPLIAQLEIAHHGDPEGTAERFHRLVSELAIKR